MEKEYIVRKIDPATPRRVSPYRPPKKNRRGGPPRGVLLGIAALLVIGAIVIVVLFTRRNGEQEEGDTSSLASQASSLAEDASSQLAEPASSAPEAVREPALPDQETPDGEPDIYPSMAVVGGTGYGLYKFSEEDTNDYIRLVSDCAGALPETATLYDILIPTSLDVMLTEEYIVDNAIDSSDQRKAIEDYIFPSILNFNASVKTVSLFDALRAHCDEYLYYRSSPSWTQRGAYYAYAQFCAAAGLEPRGLEDFEARSFEGYLGSYYHESGDDEMGWYPDTVEAFYSSSDITLSFTDRNGETASGWAVIQDGDAYSTEVLDLIFIAGDQPYAEITNDGLDDGSACIVVKETFGNVFVPFLAEHYQTVYVIDYRSYSGSVPNLAEQTGAADVILLNSLPMTSDPDLISDLSSVF